MCEDELQVIKLTEVIPYESLNLIKLPFTGYPSTHYLAEVGLIKDILINISNNDNVGKVDFFENRRLSKSYFQTMSKNLLKRNHIPSALSTIESAIKISGKVSEFHRHKSEILDRMGKTDAAISAIREAIQLEQNNKQYQNILKVLVDKAN